MKDLESLYFSQVTVITVPHGEDGDEPVTPATLFWVHTHGLYKHYQIPELEMVGVPPEFVPSSAEILNDWALYQIREGKQIKAGQTLQQEGSMVVWTAEPSPFPPKYAPMLRLRVTHVRFQCQHCRENEA